MIPVKSQRFKNRFEWKLSTLALLVSLTGFASIAGATYSLPTDRSVKWQGNVGVSGDIPSRTTIYKTLSPSGSDDTAAIKTAITGCPSGQVVKLSTGTFSISSPITAKSGITLRGSGMGKTILKGTSGMTGAYFVGVGATYSFGTSFSIIGGLTKGSTTITTSSPHGWSVGDVIHIDQLNDASADPPVSNVGTSGTCTWCGRSSGTRSLGQMAKIIAVPTSTTATLEIPTYWNYNAGRSPQAVKLSGMTTNAGIEDFTIDNVLSGKSNQKSVGTVAMKGASNCWILNIDVSGAYQTLLMMSATYRNTVRGSKVHDRSSSSPTTGPLYAIWLNPYGSANLIENNQVYHATTGITSNGAVSGNVISYNYIKEMTMTVANWQPAPIKNHGGHPMMNLMEGNYSDGRLSADNVWGTSSHNTFFRNRNFITASKTGAPWSADIQAYAQYFAFIDNVLGTRGVESVYELNNVTLSGQKAVFRFGYTGDGDGSASGNDPRVISTVLLHGNWDSATNGVVWNRTDDHLFPASLYLDSKPNWWGNVPWPAIGSDVTPMYPTVGKVGEGTPWTGTAETSNALLSAPTGLKIL